ncbi:MULTISPECIES: PepSY domain-containing protein [Streptomyces]|uniref:PepSY domain-containing protein n=1 Tax=Streptomyces TaxID=1883 RepID=UPI0019659CCC|nr:MULTISPECIES: PepSY domain-containing protein [Streptomyces]QRX95101.1 PepSY domain-containing protein [Streptomyces noursei]UJB46071.1 PepSY domain-containing protein [Streptomyces sp. A1-5]
MKRHLVIAAAAAAVLAVGTVTAVAVSGSGAGGSAPTAAPAAGNGRQDTEDLREARAARVTAPQAAAAALKAVPGKVSGLDLDQDRPGLVWDVDVLGKDGRWHEITLDARTARVLEQRIDGGNDDDHGQERAALDTARADAAGVARTAAAGHGTVTSVELDDDHRAQAVWEVETITEDGMEHKLLVDPRTGALRTAPTHDAYDDNEGGDD